MSDTILQFIHLENLLAEAAGADALRVHVLEQTKTTTSNVLTWQEVTIGLCVRAIAPGRRILSWYYQVDKIGFYAHEKLARNGPSAADGRPPEQERYEAVWQQATQLQSALVARLRQEDYTVSTDGVIHLNLASFMPGVTKLIPLPAASGVTQEAA